MAKKRVFYTELCYVLALLIMAFAAAFTAKANFGMSMVVAPAYILHLKISEYLPFFSFGVTEYVFQALLLVVTVIIMKRFKWYYLFSFITAFLYGNLLDAAIFIISPLPQQSLLIRIFYFVLGTVLCSFSVALFFKTYVSPEAYELIVKELSNKAKTDINKVKTIYDISSVVLSVALSFVFFGFGVFKGVGIGTVLCAVINGYLIGRFTKLLNRRFFFKDKFNLEKYFS